jgi:hypothetical protein
VAALSKPNRQTPIGVEDYLISAVFDLFASNRVDRNDVQVPNMCIFLEKYTTHRDMEAVAALYIANDDLPAKLETGYFT